MKPVISNQLLQETKSCLRALHENKFVVLPDRTGWIKLCDASNDELVNDLLNDQSLNFHSIYLSDEGKLMRYIPVIPDVIYNLISFTEQPLMLIPEKVVYLPGKSLMNWSSPTFCISTNEVLLTLLNRIGKPLLGGIITNNSQVDLNDNTHVVNLRTIPEMNTSTLSIIRFDGLGKIKFEKKGIN
jgi:hypothetical protein